MTLAHLLAQLLEELLDSGGTPEEACRDCPELLPHVCAGLLKVAYDLVLYGKFAHRKPLENHPPAC